MFTGGVPKQALEQVTRVFPFDRFDAIYVCCSGSFRLEQTIAQLGARGRIVGNDVSLLSCAIGTLAATGSCFPFEFVERLRFVEGELRGAPDAVRVAALLVASEMGKYTGPSEFAALHLKHYEQSFSVYLGKASEKLAELLGVLRLDGFFARDFREHAREGAQRGAAVIGFPPTYKGGYERLYRFLHTNTRWDVPAYSVFDPDDVEAWVKELHDTGAPYCVLLDKRLETLQPAAAFSTTGKRAVYVYARSTQSSYARQEYNLKPFKYEAVTPADIRADSRVEIIPTGAGEMNFLKERFLARGIAHVPGHLNFLVFLDRKLAGGFIYTRSKHDPTRTLYLLSDFSLSRERRLSKLIAMLASCKLTVAVAEKKLPIAVQHVVTTAFTDRPVSMKYRGIFELTGRGPGHLQYASTVRHQSPGEIFREWYQKHARQGGRADRHAAGDAGGSGEAS